MNKPKIQLTDQVQELIASMQGDNCATPKEVVKTIDSWITTILTGNSLDPGEPDEILKFLAALNSIKLDYMAFIIDETPNFNNK